MFIAGLDMKLRQNRPAGASSTLLNGLVSFWRLDEESGTRTDSHGSNNLTDVNTVGYDTGVIGNAADFVAANAEYLSIASNSTLNFDESTGFTFSVWLNTDGGQFAASKDDEGANRQWLWNGGTFYYFNDAGSFFTVAAGLGGGDIGVWRLCCVWYDPSDGKLHFSKDNAATVDGQALATLKETTTEMRIGETAGSYYDGQADMFGIWSRVLTADERTELYNGGSGFDPTA